MPSHICLESIFKKVGNYKIDYKSAGDFEFFVRLFNINKLNCIYLNKTFVKMKIGGTSTSGIKSYVRTSFEILRALKENSIYSNILFVMLRLPIKWMNQLIYKLYNLK